MSPSAVEAGIVSEVRSNKPSLRVAPRWGSLTALGLLTLSQVLAGCASPKEAISVTVGPEPATPRATATARPGGGGLTFEDPRLNELFAKIARGQANEQEIIEYNQGAAASEAKANTTSTVIAGEAQKSSTPEAKKIPELQYNLLPSELWDKAELVHYQNPNGEWESALAWRNLSKDDKISIVTPGKGSFSRFLKDPHIAILQVNASPNIVIFIAGDIAFEKDSVAYETNGNEKVAHTIKTGYKYKLGTEEFELFMSVTKNNLSGQILESPEGILRGMSSSKPFEKKPTVIPKDQTSASQPGSLISLTPRE